MNQDHNNEGVINEDQRKMIKPRFETGPRGMDCYQLVVKSTNNIGDILIRKQKMYIQNEARDVRPFSCA